MACDTGLRAAHHLAFLGCTALATLSGGVAAFGQTVEGDGQTVAEVVVTAQKRQQNLQDVPISVTAVTQEVLQANRITNVTDLSGVAPNMTARLTPGGVGIPQFAMRGVVSYGSVPGQDKSISLYVDGVFIGSSQGSAFELPDLERIEVLRGPQGTLFGRNSTAGAVSVITRNPSGEFGLRQELTFGSRDQWRSVTRMEFPAWGPLSASLSYVHDQRDGDIRNLGAGQVWDRTGPGTRQGVQVSPKTLGDKDADTWFAAVKFEPSGNFNMVYKFDWMENHFTPEGTALVAVNPAALGPAGALLSAALAGAPVTFAGASRPKAVNNSWTTGGYQKVEGHNLTTNLRISDNISLKNVLAYRESFIYANSEISGLGGLTVTPQVAGVLAAFAGVPPAFLQGLVGSPFLAFGSQSQSSASQWSDEAQLNYDSKYLTLTAGALYFNINAITGAPDGLSGAPAFTPFPGGRIPLGTRDLNYNYAKSTAAYVQAEAHILPNLDFMGGYRVTKDKKSGTNYIRNVPFSFRYSKTKPSYMASVSYRPTKDLLAYVKYSTGFVSGGAVADIPFPPETVRSWEAGLKGDFLDQRLRLNLAVFTAKYQGLQSVDAGFGIGRPELGTIVIEQGAAKAKGFEVEVSAVPLRGLTLNGGLGYTRARFTRLNPIYGTVDTFLPTQRPKWTANLAAQYESQPLVGEARLIARVDANWHSKVLNYAFLPAPADVGPVRFTPASWVVNTRVALRNIKLPRGDAEIALWARNLTDNDEVVFPIAFSRPPFLVSTTYYPARTFGIDIIYNY
jgi:iron complex outermembrane receptor protein